MEVCSVGGGFVGATSATVFAEWGHPVTLSEVDSQRREGLDAERIHRIPMRILEKLHASTRGSPEA